MFGGLVGVTSDLVDEQGMTYFADTDADHPLATRQAASCIYPIALDPPIGQKVLSLRTLAGQDEKLSRRLCADVHGWFRSEAADQLAAAPYR